MAAVEARRLTEQGIERFRKYLEGLLEGRDLPPPAGLADGPELTGPVPCRAHFEADRRFTTRFDMGLYVKERLDACERDPRERTVTDPAFWAWLAAMWFDQLCPRTKDGRRRPRRIDNYIPGELLQGVGRSSADVWGRHAVRTSWLLVDQHDGLVDFVLANPPHRRGQLTEDLSGRADFALCPAIIGCAALLYRASNSRPKRGAADKIPGSVRRYGPVVRQLMRNYDLMAADAKALLALLPREFDPWKAGTEA